jgi:hypothetical protein
MRAEYDRKRYCIWEQSLNWLRGPYPCTPEAIWRDADDDFDDREKAYHEYLVWRGRK